MKSGYVAAEGDKLYYRIRGKGRPLLMIPGAFGDAWWYSFTADKLSDRYKVLTYDRRANARSTMNHPKHFDTDQQTRDAEAVLHAAGEQSAYVFGNSSGAVIAVNMAQTQPQAVRAAIAHEPPLARLHPDAHKWQRFYKNIYTTSLRYGSALALLKLSIGIGLPLFNRKITRAFIAAMKHRKTSAEKRLKSGDVLDFFIKQELLPVTNYLPDIDRIKKNRIKIIMAMGKESLQKKRFYAETVQILAEELETESVIFPGHHVSFIDKPDEWATSLDMSLKKL